jgi:8-oxo-dGTP pyrophosphatase MutT (NUDIX family)
MHLGRYQVVPAAYVLLRRTEGGAEQVLLQLRQNTGYRDGFWASAAAGHVEAGESVLEAAVREAAEELAVRIDPADLVPLTTMHRTQGNGDPIDERVDFFFECRRWEGEPYLVEPHKAAALGWFALDTPPDPVVPHELTLLAALAEGAVRPVTTFGFSRT